MCPTVGASAMSIAAAARGIVVKGVGLLAIYSLGLGIPFAVAALAAEPFAAFLARFRAHLGLVEKAMGGVLVLTGIAIGYFPSAGQNRLGLRWNCRDRAYLQKSPPGGGLFLLSSEEGYMLHPEAGHST
jgi:hypothetical protein